MLVILPFLIYISMVCFCLCIKKRPRKFYLPRKLPYNSFLPLFGRDNMLERFSLYVMQCLKHLDF